jgi:hypothetical protein
MTTDEGGFQQDSKESHPVRRPVHSAYCRCRVCVKYAVATIQAYRPNWGR